MVDSKENYKFDLGVKGLKAYQHNLRFHLQATISIFTCCVIAPQFLLKIFSMIES